MIDKEYLKLSWDGRFLAGGSNNRIVWSVSAMDVFDMIFKNDDAVIFEKFSDPWSRINAYGFSFGLLTSDVTLEKIYKSNNIFDSLLYKREMTLSSINKGLVSNQDRSTYFCNPLMYHLLNYGLLNYERHSDKVIKLLKFGIDYNRWFYKFLKDEFPDEDRFTLSEEGNVKIGHTIYGSLVDYKLEEQIDIDNECNKLLDELNRGIYEFKFYSTSLNGGYSNSNVRLENGRIVKKSTDNEIEYKFLEDLKHKNLEFIPKLLEQKNGLDYLTYFQGNTFSRVNRMEWSEIESIVKKLKKLNEVSKSILGGEKVYVHGNLSPLNVVFKGSEVVGIIDWDSVKIGKEYEDLIYIVWTWLNIGSRDRNNEEVFKGLKRILNLYNADESLKCNWADKMIDVMEERLKNTVKKSKDYERIFTWVKESEIWVELYRDKIKEEIG